MACLVKRAVILYEDGQDVVGFVELQAKHLKGKYIALKKAGRMSLIVEFNDKIEVYQCKKSKTEISKKFQDLWYQWMQL